MSYQLARSLSDVDEFFARMSEDRFIGSDCEASSLDTRRAMLAGMSFAHGPDDAIYIPTGHKLGTNLPVEGVVKLMNKHGIGEENQPVFYNAKYDLNVIQRNTKWKPTKFQDALEVVYMENPDRKMKGLKLVAKEDLRFDMEPFESLFTPEEIKAKDFDIRKKNPERCVDYACADADAALRVWRAKQGTREEQAFAIKVDTKLIDVVRKVEHNGGMELNVAYIDQQMVVLEARAEALKEQIHRMAGYEFEINSPKKLGIALFERMGIPSPGMTRGKNPQHKTDAESLEKLSKAHPVVAYVIAYRKVVKAHSTYFKKLKHLEQLGLPVRFTFNMFSAPTFRFSAPGGKPEVDGGCGINIQAVSNGEAMDLMAADLSIQSDDDGYVEEVAAEDLLVRVEQKETVPDSERVDPASLPWTCEDESSPPKLMCFRETCDSCPAYCASVGIDTTRRMQKNVKLIPSVRQSFRAPEGYTMASFDYDRQELVIGANMSQEPAWVRALSNGEDMHAVTAAAAFGMSIDAFQALETDPSRKEEYKRKRGIGKILNFATLYGATAYTLANKADIAQAQADRIYNDFKNGLRTLFQWMNKVHMFSRKEGYTTTWFGRKRYLKQFYNGDRRSEAFADRSSVNTAIQGTGAEITRIAMVKVAALIEREGWTRDQVRMVMQVHDELSFIIRNDMLKEVVPKIRDTMEFKVKSWVVQLSVGYKMGQIWGDQSCTEVEEYKLAA